MNYRAVYLALIYMMGTCVAHGQVKPREVSVSIMNNAIAMPFSGHAGIFHTPVHPGLSVGYGKRINSNEKHRLFLNVRMAYIYQQRVQHIVQLFSELNYRPRLYGDFFLNTRLGFGYVHSFSDLEQFKLNDDGEYEVAGRGGRPALFSAFAIGFAYDLEAALKWRVTPFFDYQLWFQSPFVRSYVPVLPNAALHIGVILPLYRNRR